MKEEFFTRSKNEKPALWTGFFVESPFPLQTAPENYAFVLGLQIR